jgi:hypothetical protein
MQLQSRMIVPSIPQYNLDLLKGYKQGLNYNFFSTFTNLNILQLLYFITTCFVKSMLLENTSLGHVSQNASGHFFDNVYKKD